jgi:phosphocarrier protein FPr
VLKGTPAAKGLAVGRVVQWRHVEPSADLRGGDVADEHRRMERARLGARRQLLALQTRVREEADAARAEIFTVQLALLDDPALLSAVREAIDARESAASAWQRVFTEHEERLRRLADGQLAARAIDVHDVGVRVLHCLVGEPDHAVAHVPPGTVLVADLLTPSELVSFEMSRVVGVCSVAGGATSHVAILAQSLGLPAVMGIDARVLEVADGTPALLDGTFGLLRLHPDADDLERADRAKQDDERQRLADVAAADKPAVTRDGRRVRVLANLGSLDEVDQVTRFGGDGVGLLRTEFLFVGRHAAPTEDEQAATYADIARALGGERPLVVRTLDVGGDKALPYLRIPPERNPLLGERGIHVLLEHEDLLRTQLRAILRASAAGRVAVLFPMVATLKDWRAARQVLDDERVRLGVAAVPAGIMVETPSAALLADHFAREVDFFSVGTNDLAQFALAMDRSHPRLAARADALDPAVLRLIAQTTRAARLQGKAVDVCGAAAGDPQAVPILIGLGVDRLSVNPVRLPAVKSVIRRLARADCVALAARALEAASAAAVRALVAAAE